MKLQKYFVWGIAVSLLAFMGGCTVGGADDELDLDGDKVNPADLDDAATLKEAMAIWDKMTDYQREFESVYEILDYVYIFAHSDSLEPEGSPWYSQLQKRRDYIGNGVKSYPLYAKQIPSEILDTYAMCESMNDQFTAYIDPLSMSYDDFLEEFNARDTLSDLGINVKTVNTPDSTKAFLVAQLFTGSAAEKSKLRVDDTLLAIAGIALDTRLYNENIVFDLESGYVGRDVPVTVARNENGERIEFTDTLTIIPYISPSVTYKVIDSIAVISISEFASENTPSKEGTYGEFVEALEATQNTKATIIDLHGNPGGDQEQCIGVAEEMVSKDDILMIQYLVNEENTEEQEIRDSVIRSSKNGLARDRYLVFIADSNSASCSEVTLAAVLPNRHSPLVGQITYGKGVGYTILESYLKGAVLVTAVISYNTEGETYHMVGIEPDVEEGTYEYMLDKALAIAKEGTMQRTAGYGKVIRPHYKSLLKSSIQKSSIKKIPTRKDLGRYTIAERRPR